MTKTPFQRFVLGAVAALAIGLAAAPAGAQSYPTHTITVIIPFAGGSASDVVSRILLDKMSKNLGQTIIVENRPGAGGNSGTAVAAHANPDGYTLVGGGSGPVAANVSLYKNLGYDPEKELEMIGPFAGFTIIVAASATLPVKTLSDLISYAKQHPGELNFGSVGIGSSQHLAGEYFAQLTGVKITHVPYRNIAQYGPDMIAGVVPLGFQWYPNIAGPVQSKGAIPLAVAGDKRLPIVPNAPTSAEAGLPNYKEQGWFSLLAPAGTPKPILEKLSAAMKAAVEDPQVIKGFDASGAVPLWQPLDQVKKWHHDEIARYRDIITKAGIAQIE